MTGVTLQHGADTISTSKLVGLPVSRGISAAKEIFTIPSDAEPQLNGSSSFDEDILLKENDVISFYKPSGSKGF